MVGVIDVGGGLRGIYGAGVFDRCLDDNIQFGCCIGVSAGSANLASFLAKQKGRNYLFYHDYAFRKEYMSFHNLIKTGSYIGLDYVYGTLTNTGGENPINYENIKNYNGIFNVVATDAETAEATYFTKNDLSLDNYKIFNASSCIPIVCRAVEINKRKYYDGGVADPVPIDRAFLLGCEKTVLVLTKPVNFIKKSGADAKAAALLKNRNPLIAQKLRERADVYNQAVQRAKTLEKEGRCLIIAPDDCCGITTLSKNADSLDKLYKKGYNDGKAIKEFMNKR